eukprot:TRINITY_DN7106_c1_g1_i1.p1 TRINITY_DN7106_c1_g1~~TRINITY_DN7106_c1_g1_i1.p1  ORF type:complete len:367 (+),score=49.49 TRINITY_DN7106_c1_g1_i1:117-1103(+)
MSLASYDTARFGDLLDAQFDCTGRWLATAFSGAVYGHGVCVWNAATHQLASQLEGHRAPVLAVCWAEGRCCGILASGAADGKIVVWREFKSGTASVWNPIYQMNVAGVVTSIGFSIPDPSLILAVGCGDELGCLNLLTRREPSVSQPAEQWAVKSFPAHDGGITSLSWAPMSSPMVLATGPAVSRGNNVGSGKVQGRRLVTCGADGHIVIWLADVKGECWTREHMLQPGGAASSSGLLRCVSWRPNLGLPSSSLVSCTEAGLIEVWEKAAEGLPWTTRSSWSVDGDARRLYWTQGGTLLAVAVQERGALIFKESAGGDWQEVANMGEN